MADKCLIIIPAYNEEENIDRVYENIKPHLGDFDYVFINDGSKDNTGKLLDEKGLNHIDLPVNLGLSGAVQTGYKYAYQNDYEACVQFDGDGQHDAAYLSEMLKEIRNGNDIVIGCRFVTKKKDFSARMLGSRILTVVIRIMTGKKVNDPTSGFRMLNRRMTYDYAYNMNRNPEPDALCYHIRKGAKIKEVQVTMNERVAGESYLNPIASAKYMTRMILAIIFMMY